MIQLYQDDPRSSATESRTGPVLFHACLFDMMGSQLERLPHLGIPDYWAPGVPYKLARDVLRHAGHSDSVPESIQALASHSPTTQPTSSDTFTGHPQKTWAITLSSQSARPIQQQNTDVSWPRWLWQSVCPLHFKLDTQLFTSHFRLWLSKAIQQAYDMAPEEEKPQQIEAHEVKAITASISYYKIPQNKNLKSSRMVINQSFFPPLSARNCHGPGAKRASLGGSGVSFCSVKVRPKLATAVHGKKVNQTWEFPLKLDQDFLSHLQWFTYSRITQGVPLQNTEYGPVLFHGRLSDRMGSQLERLPHLGILDYWAPGVPYKLVGDGSSQTGGSPLGFPDSQWQSQTLPRTSTTVWQLLTFRKRGH